MHSAISQHRSGIATICQRYHINRLEVVGSAARAMDFNPTTLDLDARRLTAMASHLRFITPEKARQWWIKELRDNRGNVVLTET